MSATPRPPDSVSRFLAEANPAVIATIAPGGEPHTVATRYLWEDGRLFVNMDADRKRLQHLRRDPRVSLTVLGKDDWSVHVTLAGRVASLDPDPDLVSRLGSSWAPRGATGGCLARTQEPWRSGATRGDEDEAERRQGCLECTRIFQT